MASETKKRLAIPRQRVPVRPAEERIKDYEEVALGLTTEQAVLEAQRCIQCKRPRCVEGCPVEINIPAFIAAVAEGRAEAVAPLIGRLTSAGVGATGMLIAAGRHFRQLLGLVAARDGIEAAVGRLRPPAFGPRGQALAAQARRWGPARLESANRLLFQTDRMLRSAGDRPDQALVERCLIRLAMMVGRAS